MPTIIDVAQQFGNLIAMADYSAAHELLTTEAKAVFSPDDFKNAVESMTRYASGPIQEVEAMSDFMLEDWPDKQDGDLAIIYIALTGDRFCEAVTVTLVRDTSDIRIRHLEWGRP